MSEAKPLPKFAVLQLSGCAGCEVSLINATEWVDKYQLVYMPLVVSTAAVPDDTEILLVSGGVRNDEDIYNLRKATAKVDRVIAVGTCAISGGVSNLVTGMMFAICSWPNPHGTTYRTSYPKATRLTPLWMWTFTCRAARPRRNCLWQRSPIRKAMRLAASSAWNADARS